VNLQTTFAALSDPTRFAIVEALLEKGPQTAGEIAEPFGISKPAISRHLKVLEEAGMIERKVVRQFRVFRAREDGFRELDEWFERYRRFWDGSLDRLEKLFENREKNSWTPKPTNES
jgi:DNA-binding transcriptional ArsR family regulator